MPPTRIEAHLDDALADEVRWYAAANGLSVADVMRLGAIEKLRGGETINFSRDSTRFVRDTRDTVNFARGPGSPYSFASSGGGPSYVRDIWAVSHSGLDPIGTTPEEARNRIRDFQQWQNDVRVQFATATTANAAEVIPPQFKPLIANFEQDRPLFAAASKGDIANGRPFTLPGNIAEAGIDAAAAVQAEGSNRADNAVPVFGGLTATPVAIEGRFRVTRELIDASNPAIDAVAMMELHESYARQTEALIFAELNGSNGQAGTITAGQVPSGAQVRTSTGAALPADLRKALAVYMEIRRKRPRSVVAASRTSVAEALETLDSSAVPAGSEDMWVVNGCGVRQSQAISGGAAGDGDVFILGSGDLWCWSSPVLEFSYFEVQGPALVDLVLFGYFAVRLINARGLGALRHT